jgi:hypothetical protein
MSNPTTPFSWQMPTATDLVTDLPADFEVFGQAVATSMADLLGGTSGQVLAKNSNTDMDFVWVTSDDANAIQNSIVDAKGDLIGATAADTPARLAVGTNGQVLTADSTAATGLAWGTLPSPNANWVLLNSGGTALTGAQTVTVSGISGKNEILVILSQASSATAASIISLRLNTDTGSNYYAYGFKAQQGNPNVSFSPVTGAAANVPFGRMDAGNAGSPVSGYALISGCNTSGVKALQVVGSGETYSGTANMEIYSTGGYYNSSSTISSISIFSSTGNLDNGSVFVYTTA